jgi:hypothetical protein
VATVIIHDAALAEFETRIGTYAAGLLADAIAERARPLTPPMSTNPPSVKEGGDFGPYSGPPGALQESIVPRGGNKVPVVFYVLARKPVGWFRNLSGKGHAAYSEGVAPDNLRLSGGRRRKPRAPRQLYGTARGDWRSIGRAVESTNGSIITRAGVL